MPKKKEKKMSPEDRKRLIERLNKKDDKLDEKTSKYDNQSAEDVLTEAGRDQPYKLVVNLPHAGKKPDPEVEKKVKTAKIIAIVASAIGIATATIGSILLKQQKTVAICLICIGSVVAIASMIGFAITAYNLRHKKNNQSNMSLENSHSNQNRINP